MWKIEIDELPPTLNKYTNGITNWRTRHRLKQDWNQIMLAAFIRARLPKPLPERKKPYMVHTTQFCKRTVRDDDNAIIGSKFCKDALEKYGYVESDDWKHFNNGMTTTKKGKENKMVILIK